MLRLELTTNGVFNVTEYGTVKDPALFRALYAYSRTTTSRTELCIPRRCSPPAPTIRGWSLQLAQDDRALQAASTSGHPILLRASADVGHGMGSPLAALIEEAADSYAFLMSELGMRFTE